jgi:hypothetical protein
MVKANLMIAGSLSFLVLGLGLVGCGNPKDASKGNFGKAISQKLEKDVYAIPDPSDRSDPSDARSGYGDSLCVVPTGNLGVEKDKDETQEALVKVGLLTSKTVKPSKDNYLVRANEDATIYELSDQGKKIVQTPRYSNYGPYVLPVCKVVFKEVVSYTEPSDIYGMKLSRVKYSYTLEDFPAWSKDEALLKASGNLNLKRKLDKAGKAFMADMSLVLKNDGWSADSPY